MPKIVEALREAFASIDPRLAFAFVERDGGNVEVMVTELSDTGGIVAIVSQTLDLARLSTDPRADAFVRGDGDLALVDAMFAVFSGRWETGRTFALIRQAAADDRRHLAPLLVAFLHETARDEDLRTNAYRKNGKQLTDPIAQDAAFRLLVRWGVEVRDFIDHWVGARAISRKAAAAIGLVIIALSVVAGGCSDPQTGDPAAFEGMSCEERAAHANALMASAFLRECTADSECVLVKGGTGCYRGCDTPVSLEGKAAVEAAQKKARGPCDDFTKKGCAAAGPSCQVPTAAACSSGKCVGLSR